ncbi:MAG TPA: hypothetical protein VMT11_14635 [Myxococcaceae bacterium]|nr:hypothetical protein [Myxococcaceae bacterium]
MSSLLAVTTILLAAAPGDVPRAGSEAVEHPLLAVGPSVEADSTVRAVAEPRAPRASRTVRVVSEVLVAGAAGTLTGALGGYLGCIGSLSVHDSCSEGTVAAGLLTGFGLSVAAIVPLTGSYFDARGSPWVSWFGEALGAGAALGIGQGSASRLMWVGPPLMLAGAVLGYELSTTPAPSPAPRATSVERVSVVPSFGPDGRAGLVVAGRF